MTRGPKVDLVRVFCANFDSHFDYSGSRTRRRPVEWPRLSGVSDFDLMDARTSRYTLEVYNLVLAGDGSHLVPDPLAHYASLPVERVASARAIAAVLLGTEPPLAAGPLADVEAAVSSDLKKWHERAIAIVSQDGPRA